MTLVRPATLEDAEIFSTVQARNSISGLEPEAWRQRWLTCPFKEQFEGIPIGWVLESETGSVGVLSNVHVLYELDRQPIKAGIAAAWAVDSTHRNDSLQLMSAYFAQTGIDLRLICSANPTTSKVMTKLLRMKRIPAPCYDHPLLWPVRYRAFAAAALRRRGAPVPDALAWPAGVILRAAAWVRQGDRHGPGKVQRIAAFDERFDSFWSKLRCGRTRLRAVRTSAVLQWRFQTELQNRSVIVLVHQSKGEIEGYAVLLRRVHAPLGVTMCDVADLQAIGDDPTVFRALLLAAMHVAREQDADVLKFAGGEGTKRTVALSLRPYSYRIDCWQLFYKVSDAALAEAVASPTAWDFSVFDTF